MLCILGTKYAAKTHRTPTAKRKPSQLTACLTETTNDNTPPTVTTHFMQNLMSHGQVGGFESDSGLDAMLKHSLLKSHYLNYTIPFSQSAELNSLLYTLQFPYSNL